MAPRPEHIPLKRRPSTQNEPSPSEEVPRARQRSLNDEVDRLRRFKIGAVLLAVFSLLMLVALLSYARADEANAQLTMRDVMRVIQGDSEIRMKFDQTQNWIGLFGAVLANWMYTGCIGLWSAVLPVLLMLWSYDLFRFQRITPLVARRSIVSISAFTALASLVASLQLIEGFDFIPREATGAIGQFLAGVTTPLVGRFGSILIWFLVTSAFFVFGFQLNVRSMSVTGQDLLDSLRARIAHLLSYVWTKEPTDGVVDGPQTDEEEDNEEQQQVPDTYEEPAALRRTSFFSSDKRSIIRPRNLDEEPAAMLRRPAEQEPEDTTSETSTDDVPFGQQLSGSVRILRPIKPEQTSDVPKTQQRSAAAHPPAPQPPSVDLSEVEKRLQQLHPTKDIALFPREDEETADEADVPDTEIAQPEIAVVQRPVTVKVQDTLFPIEPEVQLSNVTLYDEEIAYKPPVAGLLVDIPDEGAVDDSELEANAKTLQEKLETFRVRIENLTVTPGPVVTQYEFVPASGIKVSQIENLADDIALALKAQGVRIIAPIPGKGTVGIEIPNQHPAIVRFSSIIKSPKYHK